ncbi:universal stress protein [Haloplanus rubicundus]|uniref:Universal stress protein n=1 Tax=Haloplanus rubicundus TaxID=1547898 RepID=A0A345EF49_9EURY|nr:universal stress protein [Haloplanus rubicundus]AXG10821.1 universal stress protein [Haloplanus rubicundus]
MYDTILVPTDGSDVAVVAADAAVTLAQRFGADVRGLYVRDGDGADDGDRATAAVAERAAAADVEATTAVVDAEGPVHRRILADADEHGADCIVMGTHGRTGLDRFVLGSVAERTLRESSVPVLTVHEDTVVDRNLDAILVPTDGSDCSEAAAAHAVDLALATDAALHVVHVVDAGVLPMDGSGAVFDELQRAGQRALDSVVERAERAGVSTIRASVLSGTPYRAITDYADAEDVALVVMGTHGRTGFDRYLLGSVTERVVRLTDRPVLTVDDADGR